MQGRQAAAVRRQARPAAVRGRAAAARAVDTHQKKNFGAFIDSSIPIAMKYSPIFPATLPQNSVCENLLFFLSSGREHCMAEEAESGSATPDDEKTPYESPAMDDMVAPRRRV